MADDDLHTSGNGPEKRNKFSWIKIITFIIITALIVVLAYWLFAGFGKKPTVKSTNYLEQRITANAGDASDNNYFVDVQLDEYTSQIYVTEVIDGQEQSYHVSAPLGYLRSAADVNSDFYKNVQKASINSNGGTPSYDHGLSAAPAPKNYSWIWSLVSILLPMVVLVIIFLAVRRANSGSGGSNIFNQGKNQARKVISDKRFSDVAGQEEVKEEIKEVVDFLKSPNKYKNAGARIPKGILLGGPPGTGKTLLAKATAGEAGVPFYFISASNFIEMFAGVGAKRVREMFKEARKNSPAILFIDELDAVGRKRGATFGDSEREQTLNQILVEMDGMEENVGLLIIAATNRPDVLDPALQRPGRFDRTITVNNPDIKERQAILELHAKGKRISPEVDFANIAKRTPGYSGAQIENIINEATLLSVREKTSLITLEQIDEAIDRVIAGPAKKHRVITPEELELVAYHEAGHAVIGLKVADAELVQKITIIPRGDAGGYTLMTPKKETYNFKKSELEAKLVSFMGGRAAEQIIYGAGEVSTGAHNDIERATAIARAMVTQYGMSILGPIAYEKAQGPQYLGQDQRSRDYSDALAERIDEAIRELIIGAEKKAIEVIGEHRLLLELIKDELLEKETIVIEEIDYINEHLQRSPKRDKIEKKSENKSLRDLISEVEKEKTTTDKEDKTESKSVSPEEAQVKDESQKDEDNNVKPSKDDQKS